MEILNGYSFSVSSGNVSDNLSEVCDASRRESANTLRSVGKSIALYFAPVVGLIGIASNVLVCCVVLQRRTPIHSKGKLMYGAIALADSLQLAVHSLGRVLFYHAVQSGFAQPNISACKLHLFLSVLTVGLSNSYAATFAVERCVSVYRLSRSKVTHVHLLLVIALVTVLQTVVSVPARWMVVLPTGQLSSRVCEISPMALTNPAFIVTQLFTVQIPCFLFLASDCALLNFLLRRRRTRKACSVTRKLGCSAEVDTCDAKLPTSNSSAIRSESTSTRRRAHPAETGTMKTIIGNTRTVILMSSLRCAFLFGSIALMQASHVEIYYRKGRSPDYCVSDMLYSASMIVFGAGTMLLSSNLYILLWRVRAFSNGFRKLCSKTTRENERGDTGRQCNVGFRSMWPSSSAV